ncbi:MAG: hypothetical protein HDS89_06810 [Bacteroidales bacterium]|nr:hypothetical protein [Bacteroidales bacterium]
MRERSGRISVWGNVSVILLFRRLGGTPSRRKRKYKYYSTPHLLAIASSMWGYY